MGDDAPIVGGEGDVNEPIDHLSPDFFQLRSGFAGSVAQKMASYHRTLAVVGDIAAYLAESNALRGWVRETNRGSIVWFVPNDDELIARLGKPR